MAWLRALASFRTPPEFQQEMRRALSAAAEAVDQESSKPRDFQAAKAFVELLREKGELDESTLFEFARGRKYEETAVALSLLSSASLDIVKPLMKSPRDDGLLIPCKAADCKWETVSAILAIKLPPPELPRRRDTRISRLISRNYPNRTPSDCFDFGRSAR